jgi:hypothetical protein
MTETTEKIRPYNTTARTLRPILREAGVESLVRKFGTGKNATYIRIRWVAEEGGDNMEAANAVADALRPLWLDGATRVKVLYGGTVIVWRKDWWKTLPDTPEARAQLKAEEDERNQALLTKIAEGGKVRACDCLSSVTFQPVEDDPRHPWLKKGDFGFPDQRFTPFEVYYCNS